MKRREFIGLSAGAVLWPSAAEAQRKVHRIGYLSAPSQESVQRTLDALLRKMRELGWIDGANITILYRWAEGDVGRLPALAADLVQQKVDLIIAPNTAAVVAARGATSSIPIVTIFTSEPVQLNLASSLRNPGGNVTGTTFTAGPGYAGKLLEFLKQAVPAINNVGVLADPSDPAAWLSAADLQAAAAALGVRLEGFDVSTATPLDQIVARAAQRNDAVMINAAGTLMPQRRRLAELAIERRLPMIASLREFAESGVLLSYGVNMAEFVGRAATYVDKILKGEKPGDLAMEQPTRYELLVNLKSAKAMKIDVSPAVLARADEVIE